MKRKPCPKCLGTGTEPDHVFTGRRMGQIRKNAGLTVTQMAQKLKCHRSFISYLEAGKRSWSLALIEKYQQATIPPQ